MRLLSRRQLRKFKSKCSKWIVPFLSLLTFFFLLRRLVWTGGDDDNDDDKAGLLPLPEELDWDHPQLRYIRRNHLFRHEPSAPTNYSGGHQGWMQSMSKTVAQRLGFKRNGFFVECGALDGIYLSNSLLLEMEYGWSGLLIEADPTSVPKLKSRNRRAWVADVCLSPTGSPMMADMTQHKIWPEINYIVQDPQIDKARRRRANGGYDNRTAPVQCYPLSMLMDAMGRSEIDYFSLDVEGMELDILRTIPFDRIRIQLISVEVRTGQDEKIRKFLGRRGYRRISQIKVPTDFIHDDLYEYGRWWHLLQILLHLI